MGLHDGVSKLWVLRREHGLDVQGFKDEIDAIESLIRTALTWGPPETRAQIEAAVARGMTHLDEPADGSRVDEDEDRDA